MRSFLHKFDLTWTNWIQQWPDWIRPVMVTASAIGHPVVTVGIAACIVGIGWAKLNMRLMAAGGVAIATIALGSLMKLLLHRPRPLTDYVLHMRFDTFSFPSGHTLGSSMAFGLLAHLAWQLLPSFWNMAAAIGLVILIILVGVSRVYLGAHHPSDVVAGWLLGSVGMAIIIFVVQPIL